MKNITANFGTLYHPEKAILIYRKQQNGQQYYVECYDLNADGRPINAHPLSVREASGLAKALQSTEKKEAGFLTPKGLMPSSVLHIRSGNTPFVIWRTPARTVKMLFTAGLELPNGDYPVPALVWKANRSGMSVFAIPENEVPNMETPLFHAPFFNTYERGTVCMGNVALQIPAVCALEDFMAHWEKAFFGSYFSHMMEGHNPVNGNMVQLYRTLHESKKAFPEKALKKTSYLLKHLIN